MDYNTIEWDELDEYRDIGFKRKTPAGDGGYQFEGEGSVTALVKARLSPIEAFNIVTDLKGAVEKSGGLGAVQIFESAGGRREVWTVMIDGGWIMMMREEAKTTGLMQEAIRWAQPTRELARA